MINDADNQELINAIALSRLNYFSLDGLVQLYQLMGSATEVVKHRFDIRSVLPDASDKLEYALKNMDDALHRAEAELQWDMEHNVQVLCMNSINYPQRLKNCADAPLVLFYRGTANLNQARVINMVGTRKCTLYGQDIIRRFVRELNELCPGVLVVSGLAYGVDINAHVNALENGMETVGVLAHGLDTLYPAAHRNTANRMVKQGGLLTEFLTLTNADKMNFVRRNRIVAGMCDATILVESARKGGGLITTGIANSYGRDVFAFPGPVTATYSEGCNNLIRDNGAQLISNAADFVNAMGWQDAAQLQQARKEGIERQMFPELSADEQRVVNELKQHNDLQINLLTVKTGLPIAKLTAVLFTLELKGVLKQMAGGTCHLMN